MEKVVIGYLGQLCMQWHGALEERCSGTFDCEQKRKGGVATEAEIRDVPIAKEFQWSTETGRGRNRFSPSASEGRRSYSHLVWSPVNSFQTFGLQNCEKINFCCFPLPNLTCYNSHRNLIEAFWWIFLRYFSTEELLFCSSCNLFSLLFALIGG